MQEFLRIRDTARETRHLGTVRKETMIAAGQPLRNPIVGKALDTWTGRTARLSKEAIHLTHLLSDTRDFECKESPRRDLSFKLRKGGLNISTGFSRSNGRHCARQVELLDLIARHISSFRTFSAAERDTKSVPNFLSPSGGVP